MFNMMGIRMADNSDSPGTTNFLGVIIPLFSVHTVSLYPTGWGGGGGG